MLAVVTVLAVVTSAAGCSSSTTDGDRRPVEAREFTSYAELHAAALKAGVPCDTYTPGRGLGVSETDQPATCVGEGSAGVVGDEAMTVLELWPTRAEARAWLDSLLDSDTDRNSPAPRLLGANWLAFGDRANLELLRDELGGHIYSADGPLPPGYVSGVGVDTPPADPAPTATEPGAAAEDECLDSCKVTVDKILEDLGAVLCPSAGPGAALSNDITDNDPFHLSADVIRVCSAGGSVDLSGLGIVHVYDDHDQMTHAGLTKLNGCPIPGAAVFGGSDGEPGWLVVGIQSGKAVVRQLIAAGSTQVC